LRHSPSRIYGLVVDSLTSILVVDGHQGHLGLFLDKIWDLSHFTSLESPQKISKVRSHLWHFNLKNLDNFWQILRHLRLGPGELVPVHDLSYSAQDGAKC